MKGDNTILQQLGDYLRDTLQMELLNTGHVASEALFNSIQSVVEYTLGGISISAQGFFYAKFVNAGRRAGAKGIPLNVLMEWIRQRKFELHGKRAESVAYAIQISIKQRGIAPAPFIDKAVKIFETSGKINSQLEKIMSQFLDNHLKSIFTKITA